MFKLDPRILVKIIRPKEAVKTGLIQPTQTQPTQQPRGMQTDAYIWNTTGLGNGISEFAQKEFKLPFNIDFHDWFLNEVKENMSNPNSQIYKTLTDLLTFSDLKPNTLQEQQRFVFNYMNFRTPYRGCVIVHELGTGKTITACLVLVDAILSNVLTQKIAILLPASIKAGFIMEITRILGNRPNLDADTFIKEHFQFITYKTKITVNALKSLYNSSNKIENTYIVVDEAHNLTNQIVSGSTQGNTMYSILMNNTVNCKLIFLTGRPMINIPYELGIMFNLLRGYVKTPENPLGYSLFPEDEKRFEELFVDYEKEEIVNPYLFSRRISGLVSFYTYPKSNTFPVKELHELSFDMSQLQFKRYTPMRDIEKELEELSSRYSKNQTNVGHIKNTSNFSSNKKEVTSTFRTYTREICNFAFPDEISRPYKRNIKPAIRTWYYNLITVLEKSNQQLDAEETTEREELKKILLKYPFEDIASSFPQEAIETFITKVSNLPIEKRRVIIDKFIKKNLVSTTPEENIKKCVEELYTKKLVIILNQLSVPQYMTDESIRQSSPKMAFIMNKLSEFKQTNKLHISFIYTQYTTLEGVAILERLLQYRGYTRLSVNPKKDKDDTRYFNVPQKVDEDTAPDDTETVALLEEKEKTDIEEEKEIEEENKIEENKIEEHKPEEETKTEEPTKEETQLKIENATERIFSKKADRYICFIGDETKENRAKLLALFNDRRNLYGEYISVVIGSSASSEGINLKGVTTVFILEPHWNMNRIEQAIGRAYRYDSHSDLKPEERRIDAYILKCKFTKEQKEKYGEQETTDENVYGVARKKKTLETKFMSYLSQSSVDCGAYLNQQTQCLFDKKFIPTVLGKNLYLPNIDQDIARASDKNIDIIAKKISWFAFKSNDKVITAMPQTTFYDPDKTPKFWYRKINGENELIDGKLVLYNAKLKTATNILIPEELLKS